jgi:hypothetical protein
MSALGDVGEGGFPLLGRVFFIPSQARWGLHSLHSVMNSTCIHERTGDPNIYMYMTGKIYKESPEEIQ